MYVEFLILLSFEAVLGCSVTVGGQTYNLDSLQTQGTNGVVSVTAPSSEGGEYKYEASFCTDLVPCSTYITGNLVRNKGDICEGVYGKWQSAVNTKTTNGYSATFTSTQYCSDDYSTLYKSEFNFLCDKSAGVLGTIKAEQVGSTNCEYSVDVHTNLVCAGSVPVNSGGSEGGLSGGSIFLIVLVVLLIVYVIAGFGWNYHKEKSVKCGQKDFWCVKLPYWTKTGCLTSWVSTLNCCKFSYAWCCTKIFRVKAGDDKMAASLVGDDLDND